MTETARFAVRLADDDEQIAACYDCIAELRPHVERDSFVERVRGMQPEGFRLAYIEDDGRIVAVAGFRFMHTLFAGDSIYVDDLVTLASERSKGHGATLVEWLRSLAHERGASMLHLDSGVQRAGAHRFYFATGFHINCLHFAQLLDDAG